MRASNFLVILLLLMVSGTFVFPVVGGSGTCYIPHYNIYYNEIFYLKTAYTYFFVSNITGSNIDVEITFYKANSGDILLDGDDSTTEGFFRAENVLSYDESPVSGSSVKFSIAPHKTAKFSLKDEDEDECSVYGYGVIEWSQNSSVLKGLIAHGMVIATDGYLNSSNVRKSGVCIPINEGQPF